MSVVTTAEVPVFPTFKGFRTAVVGETDSAATAASASFGDRFASGVGSAVKGVGAVIGGALLAGASVAAVGVGAIFKKGLDRALNIQDATAQLEGLGHSAEAVETIMGNALASVRGTAFGLDAAATVAATAVAAGIRPGAELERTLKLTADAATIAKVPLSEIGSVIGKVASSGKLSTEVLNQFSDRGVPALQFVADEYGVTAEEASKMVSRGEVDFARFQDALEAGVGGAALSSGDTARGAFSNIGAAFGRLGAMFVQPAVAAAPALFQSIAAAVDRGAAVLAPYAAQFGTVLVPAIAAASAYIDGIDFTVVAANIGAALATVKGFVTDLVASFQTGDFSTLGSSLGDIDAVVRPLFPLFVQLGQGIGGISGSIGQVIAAGLPLLVPLLEGFAQVLSFLGDNPSILAAALVALAAGFVVSKVATVANNAAITASIPLRYAELASAFATRSALTANTAARLAENGAIAAGTAVKNGGILANIRSAASTVAATSAAIAASVAQKAMAVAQGIATAAQWAFNAALTANPIGIIIALIVALVAGLVYFFTQTELGQAIWAEFTRFLGEAWTNVVNGIKIALDFLSAVFTAVWSAIVSGVTGYVNFVRAVIIAVVTGISSFWSGVWSGIGNFFRGVWEGIVGFVKGAATTIATAIVGFVTGVRTNVENVIGFIRDLPGKVLGFLGNLGGLLVNSGKALIQGFLDGINGMLGKIGDVVGGVMDFIGGFFPNSPAKRGRFSGSGWTGLSKSGRAVVDEFASGFDDPPGPDFPGLGAAAASLTGGGAVAAGEAASGSGTTLVFEGDSAAFMEWMRVYEQRADGTRRLVIANGKKV